MNSFWNKILLYTICALIIIGVIVLTCNGIIGKLNDLKYKSDPQCETVQRK